MKVIQEICNQIMQYPYSGIPRAEKYRLCAWLEENNQMPKEDKQIADALYSEDVEQNTKQKLMDEIIRDWKLSKVSPEKVALSEKDDGGKA